MPASETKTKRRRRPLRRRIAKFFRRALFPRPTVSDWPDDTRVKRWKVIVFTAALLIATLAGLTVIALEGGFDPAPPPAEE